MLAFMKLQFLVCQLINVGLRQKNRAKLTSVFNVDFNSSKIVNLIRNIDNKKFKPFKVFGKGNSAKKIAEILLKNRL